MVVGESTSSSPSAIGTLASLAAIGVVAAATSRGASAVAPPTASPTARSGAVSRVESGRMQHAPGTVRRIPHTRAQLALTRPPGSPGSVLPPLRRAAPDRTIWRAPELKDLPRDLLDDEGGRPAPHWKMADPREDRLFARRATPRPTAHRTPIGFTRRAWRRYDPVSLGLSAEELGHTLPATVDPAQAQPMRARPAADELAGLAIARRTGELVAFSIDTHPDGAQLAPGHAAAQAGQIVLDSGLVNGFADADLAAAHIAGDLDLAALVQPGNARRGRIRTRIDGVDVTDGVAVEQPANVPLSGLVRVATAPAFDLERARAASSRAVAAIMAPARRAERSVAGGVALLVIIASFIGVSPLAPAAGGIGNVGREAPSTRIGLGAFIVGVDGTTAAIVGVGGQDLNEAIGPNANTGGELPIARTQIDLIPVQTSNPNMISSLPNDATTPLADRFLEDEDQVFGTDDQGPFNADGTLVKPIAVETTVPDGKDQLRTYKVKKGDSAADIAKRFKVTTATLVWSNDLVDEPVLKIGATLVIPPVNGLVHVVQDGDTLSAIARRTGVDFRKIMETNGLTETTVFIGQTLIIPGGKGEHIGTPPAAAGSDLNPGSSARPSTVTVPRRSVSAPSTYAGGSFAWPLPGGTISQYYHYGHYAVDIAGDYGLPVYAAADGVVVFAGWKNNGGGWQVWLAHGSGLYTTYNHMSGISVGTGQVVGRGGMVGRNGSSGYATGPHVHFEVWLGGVWDGGRRVNPLNYL